MSIKKIDSYTFGSIVIDGVTYDTDVILLPDRVIENWWRKDGHLLCPEDLTEVIKSKPEIFIIGRGMYDKLKVTLETHALLQANNIELIEIDSQKACDEYNALAPTRAVAAGIHLTC